MLGALSRWPAVGGGMQWATLCQVGPQRSLAKVLQLLLRWCEEVGPAELQQRHGPSSFVYQGQSRSIDVSTVRPDTPSERLVLGSHALSCLPSCDTYAICIRLLYFYVFRYTLLHSCYAVATCLYPLSRWRRRGRRATATAILPSPLHLATSCWQLLWIPYN